MQIIKAAHDAGLGENVYDLGYQHHARAVDEQRKASLLILPLRKEPEYKAVLPGKLFEYLASYRPILGIGQPDGAMSMILDSTRTGVVFDWEDKEAMAKYIDECWEKHLEGRLRIEGDDISQFTRRNLTLRMVQLFEELTKK